MSDTVRELAEVPKEFLAAKTMTCLSQTHDRRHLVAFSNVHNMMILRDLVTICFALGAGVYLLAITVPLLSWWQNGNLSKHN